MGLRLYNVYRRQEDRGETAPVAAKLFAVEMTLGPTVSSAPWRRLVGIMSRGRFVGFDVGDSLRYERERSGRLGTAEPSGGKDECGRHRYGKHRGDSEREEGGAYQSGTGPARASGPESRTRSFVWTKTRQYATPLFIFIQLLDLQMKLHVHTSQPMVALLLSFNVPAAGPMKDYLIRSPPMFKCLRARRWTSDCSPTGD